MTRIAMRFEEWPEADRQMWKELTLSGSILDDRGALAHLKPISQEGLLFCYGHWLGWLRRTDSDLLGLPPILRATAHRFVAWIGDHGHLAPESRQRLAEKMLRVLQAEAPSHDWSGHKRLINLLRHESRIGRSTRKDGRIVSSAVLFAAADRHAAAHDGGGEPASLKEAKQRRDATMIAFLALMPVRRRSFHELELGRSVLTEGDQILIRLDAKMTKTSTVWEAPVPRSLHPLLSRYIDEVRPWFLERGKVNHAMLWVSNHGRPYHPIHLGQRITQITWRLVGVRVCPQLFRDCAATTLAYTSPDNARLTRALLGHSNFRTGERHYNQATMVEASRTYSALIDDLQKASG